MVSPIYPLAITLIVSFLLTLTDKISRKFSISVFLLTLLTNTLIFGSWTYNFWFNGAEAQIIHTAGFISPLSISLKLGIIESTILFLVSGMAFLNAINMFKEFTEKPIFLQILYLMLTLGIIGLIMTRDLFNMFVFLEILSIATFSLILFDKDKKSIEAGFKYVLASGLASSLVLIGIVFIYKISGTLSIDILVGSTTFLLTKIGFVATFILLFSLFIELKPFPANGWAIDVYESANSGIVSLIAVGNSAAIFFSIWKLFPIFSGKMTIVFAFLGIITFFFSNLIGLKQKNAKRLLGYSSAGQMGLLLGSLLILKSMNVSMTNSILIGSGFFLSHFFAKAGLFWISRKVVGEKLKDWSILRQNKGILLIFVVFILALLGLPPFPSFWAKWNLVRMLVSNNMFVWLAFLVLGSLFEVVYLFRWIGYSVKSEMNQNKLKMNFSSNFAISIFFFAIIFISLFMMNKIIMVEFWITIPLIAMAFLYFVDFLPAKLKAILSMAIIGYYSYLTFFTGNMLMQFFAILFIGGSLILLISTMNRKKSSMGFYPLLVLMIISLGNLIYAHNYLDFFISWEFMTISSYFLILRGKKSEIPSLKYIVFSMAGAFLLIIGFAFAPNIPISLPMIMSLPQAEFSFFAILFLALGFLIKSGALGIHIWVPGSYAEAEDDMTPFISSILSKAGVFGLFAIATGFLMNADKLNIFYFIGWIGILTALVGAFLATFQEDAKKLLAYSSMSQIGYIVASIGLLSHLGWVSALYQTFNHMLFKGLIFIAIAGVISRTGTRKMYEMGGLIKKMPISFISVLIGIIAVSGVPPLSGFGSKWLLYTSFIEQGWYLQAGVLFFASAVSFLYLYRLIHTVFLGQMKFEHQNVKEASVWYLIPQFIFIGALMAISMFPNLIIKPLNMIAANYFDSSIVIDGYTITSSLGYWNGNLIMNVTMGVFALPLIGLFLFNGKAQKVKQFNIVYAAERPESPQLTHVAHNMFAHYKKALGHWTKPRIKNFWDGIQEKINALSGLFRRIYTGNGQTYLLHILLYMVVIYFILGV